MIVKIINLALERKNTLFTFEILPDTETSLFYVGYIPSKFQNNTKFLEVIQDDYWVIFEIKRNLII